MTRSARSLFTAAVLVATVPTLLRAQAPVDPSGHWDGYAEMQGSQLAFGVDFLRDSALR